MVIEDSQTMDCNGNRVCHPYLSWWWCCHFLVKVLIMWMQQTSSRETNSRAAANHQSSWLECPLHIPQTVSGSLCSWMRVYRHVIFILANIIKRHLLFVHFFGDSKRQYHVVIRIETRCFSTCLPWYITIWKNGVVPTCFYRRSAARWSSFGQNGIGAIADVNELPIDKGGRHLILKFSCNISTKGLSATVYCRSSVLLAAALSYRVEKLLEKEDTYSEYQMSIFR